MGNDFLQIISVNKTVLGIRNNPTQKLLLSHPKKKEYVALQAYK